MSQILSQCCSQIPLRGFHSPGPTPTLRLNKNIPQTVAAQTLLHLKTRSKMVDNGFCAVLLNRWRFLWEGVITYQGIKWITIKSPSFEHHENAAIDQTGRELTIVKFTQKAQMLMFTPKNVIEKCVFSLNTEICTFCWTLIFSHDKDMIENGHIVNFADQWTRAVKLIPRSKQYNEHTIKTSTCPLPGLVWRSPWFKVATKLSWSEIWFVFYTLSTQIRFEKLAGQL